MDPKTKTPPPRSSQLPLDNPSESTPLKQTLASSQYASERLGGDARIAHVEIESRGKWYGPMDPSKFLDKFLPKNDGLPRRPSFRKESWEQAFERCNVEADMYKEFMTLLQPYCTRIEVKTTADKPDDITWSHQSGTIKVDMSIYSKDNLPSPSQPLDITKLDAFLELKLHAGYTGFDDQGVPFEKDTAQSRHTRGQLATYAGATMASQFRTHVFCIEVAGKMARLIRIDREVAIVTSAFCWYENNHLVDFFWRFNHADRALRGYDPSVSPADAFKDPDAATAMTMLPKYNRHTVLWKFEIYDEISGKTVVLYALLDTHGLSACPFGRYTRGFIAITADGQKVWLKETWRICLDDMKKEGTIYKELREKDVPHILTVIAHGDAKVAGAEQKTVSLIIPEFFKKKFPNVQLRPFCHYYIVFKEVCRPLNEFDTTREFVSAIKDGMEAHRAAYDRLKILHRDVSAGNILIRHDGKEGFLIDWDFSKEVTDDESPRQRERTGTWQFMSAQLLLGTSKRHTRADDLESFFYVLCWLTLNYTSHNIAPNDVEKFMKLWFDFRLIEREGGASGGGDIKWQGIVARVMKRANLPEGPLRQLICTFEDLLAVRYVVAPPTPADRATYAIIVESTKHLPSPQREDVLKSQAVWQYDTDIRNLEDWSYIFERFREALEDRSKLADKRVARNVKNNLTFAGAGSANSGSKRTGDHLERGKSEKRQR
ncbi:hypothetical protein VNI00_014134 [Paramarasmius palmivorus]|uniref:Protein kinase domain-containing protein n=1 Tax=Paramarasmius palmivorus TaxID=297713 RepID=A0AAW0BUB4_9AGAR